MTLAIASLVLGLAPQVQDEVNWVRTFKDKERIGYHMKFTLDKPAATLDADLGIRTLAVKSEGNADVQMGASNIVGFIPIAGGNGEMTVETVKSTVTKHGLPDKIAFEQGKGTFLYAFLTAAGATGDKKVKAGSTFTISWTNATKKLVLEGQGKVLEISAADKTMKFEVTYAIDIKDGSGMSFTYRTTSVSRTDDGSLVSSNGEVIMGPLTWKIEITRP